MSVTNEDDGSQNQLMLFETTLNINLRQTMFRILDGLTVDKVVRVPRELSYRKDSLNLAVNMYRRDNPKKGITLKTVSKKSFKLWRWK